MVQKRLMQVDAETGELIEEGFVAYVAQAQERVWCEVDGDGTGCGNAAGSERSGAG